MRKRRLREILALPRDDRETAIADKYIRRECERIRETWSERERHYRATGDRDRVPWKFPTVHVSD
jgi:hypothetical protein